MLHIFYLFYHIQLLNNIDSGRTCAGSASSVPGPDDGLAANAQLHPGAEATNSNGAITMIYMYIHRYTRVHTYYIYVHIYIYISYMIIYNFRCIHNGIEWDKPRSGL